MRKDGRLVTAGALEARRKASEMPLVDKGRRGVERLGRRAEARLAKALEAQDLGSFCDVTELNSFCR